MAAAPDEDDVSCFKYQLGDPDVGLTLGEGGHLSLLGSQKWMWHIATPSNPQLGACQRCMVYVPLIVVVAL